MTTTPTAAATTLEFTTPPGWLRLDLRQDPTTGVLAATDELLAPLPPEHRARARGRVNAALREAALGARSAGAVQLVLPLDLDTKVTLPASFIIQPLPVPDDVDPLLAVAAITAGESGFAPVELPQIFALRSADEADEDDAARRAALAELVVEDSPEARAEIDRWSTGASSVRVRYIVGDPEVVGSWHLVVFLADRSSDPQAQELAEVLVKLFDLIMATARVVTADPGPTGPASTEL
jgi:hypothetical protein